MRDGHRAASADLAQKRRHNTPSAPEDVPKSHRDKFPFVLHRRALDDELGHSLGRAHYAGWAHRFVGGDEDEVLTTSLQSGVHYVARAEHVVRDRLDHVLLHQWHVLVCRGVKHRVRLVELENCRDALPIPHVGDHRHEANFREARRKLVKDVEDGILAVSEENEARWSESGDLATELAADRSPGTSYENGFASGEL